MTDPVSAAHRLRPTTHDLHAAAADPSRSHAPPSQGALGAGFRAYLRDVSRESAALEGTLRAAWAGRGPSDDQALLALQARMYRYSEQLDLAGRLVEKATSAVKQTLSATT